MMKPKISLWELLNRAFTPHRKRTAEDRRRMLDKVLRKLARPTPDEAAQIEERKKV